MLHPFPVRLVVLFTIALGAHNGCASSTATGPGVVDKTSNFEPFLARDIDGQTLDLAPSVGRDVLFVSFWSTYCEPCKAEMRFLQRFHERYQQDGLTIVSVALDGPETVAEVAPYIRKQGYTFRVVQDASGDIAQALNPTATAPFAILVGRNGRVVRRISGFQPSEAPQLEAELKALLGLAP